MQCLELHTNFVDLSCQLNRMPKKTSSKQHNALNLPFCFLAFNGGLQSINNQEKMIFNCYFSSFSASLCCWWCSAVTAVFSRSRAVELFPLWIENKSIKYQNKKNSKKFDHQTEIYLFIEKNHQVL